MVSTPTPTIPLRPPAAISTCVSSQTLLLGVFQKEIHGSQVFPPGSKDSPGLPAAPVIQGPCFSRAVSQKMPWALRQLPRHTLPCKAGPMFVTCGLGHLTPLLILARVKFAIWAALKSEALHFFLQE